MIDVDGIEAGRTPLPAPLRVAGGTHVIGALATGHLPSRREITDRRRRDQGARLRAHPTEARLAHLALDEHDCRAPRCWSTERWWDARRWPRRWLSPRGRGWCRCGARGTARRDGSWCSRRAPRASSTSSSRRIRGHRPSDKGLLALQLRETEVHVAVNGRARGVYSGSARPCPPAHTACGCNAPASSRVERDVVLRAGAETSIRMTLVPTPETRLAYVERVQARKRWGCAGAGRRIGAGAGRWRAGDLEPAEPARAGATGSMQRRVTSRSAATESATRSNGSLPKRCAPFVRPGSTTPTAQLSNRKVMRNISAVGAGVGVAAVAVGVYLLLTNDDPSGTTAARVPGLDVRPVDLDPPLAAPAPRSPSASDLLCET